MRLRTKLVAAAASVAVAMSAAPATSNAYLHVANAQNLCATPAQMSNMYWRQTNGWSPSVWWTSDPAYKRTSDTNVLVHDMVWGLYPATRGDYICRVVGDDSNATVTGMNTPYLGAYWAGTLAW